MKKDASLLSLPVGAGLLIILTLISLCVYETPPKPPADPDLILHQHQSLAYGIDAEMMAQRLSNPPGTRWPYYKSGPMCFSIGRGVWYAIGAIAVPIEQPPYYDQVPWEVCFLAESQTPLYIRVGSVTAGNAQAAMQRAGRSDNGEGGPARDH